LKTELYGFDGIFSEIVSFTYKYFLFRIKVVHTLEGTDIHGSIFLKKIEKFPSNFREFLTLNRVKLKLELNEDHVNSITIKISHFSTW